ncbi:MAG: hypothetical protein AB7G93_20725 [Bdellovibrionales bacterium]
MNFTSILSGIQDVRTQLDSWGVSTNHLILIAGVALIFMVFSLREVLTWYLRVHHLRAEVREMRSQLEELHRLVSQNQELLKKSPPEQRARAVEPVDAPELDVSRPALFRLDH